ncbi:hypothetical protein EVAR_41022_1 [Eumeta japonica]|uniref:Uncharacterized protein n=1 Tax=Eumeta variegata TaxID=151549 RepID=A0A4C1YXM1_EUMVA|nr:hypothetical protein EVAR_41022_1 [Eumeta japonica]
MKHYHERFNHGNHNTVMNEMEMILYHVVAIETAKNRPCQWCRINRSLPKMPSAEGDLCLPNAYVITNPCGRLFGPMSVTIGRRPKDTGRYSHA